MNWYCRKQGREWFVTRSLGEGDEERPPSYVSDSEVRIWVEAPTAADALEDAQAAYEAWQKEEVFG